MVDQENCMLDSTSGAPLAKADSVEISSKAGDMLLYEYWQLRQEIRDRLTSIRNILLATFTGVAAILTLVGSLMSKEGANTQVVALALLVPFALLIPSLSFVICEELSVAVLARYIRTHIELAFFDLLESSKPLFFVRKPFGWETYLFNIRDRKYKQESAAGLKGKDIAAKEKEIAAYKAKKEQGLHGALGDSGVKTIPRLETEIENKLSSSGSSETHAELETESSHDDQAMQVAIHRDYLSTRAVIGFYSGMSFVVVILSLSAGLTELWARGWAGTFGARLLDWGWFGLWVSCLLFGAIRMALLIREYLQYVKPHNLVDIKQQPDRDSIDYIRRAKR